MKRLLIGFTSLVFVFVMAFATFSFVKTQDSVTSNAIGESSVDNVLRFDDNGKFKILHVADTHLKYGMRVEETLWLIGVACDREKPNLVVLTGDNLYNYDDANETKKLIGELMTVFESRNIPVAVTFGNHDSERGTMTRDELLDSYNAYSCSLSNDVKELSGTGTYNLPILSKSGDKVAFNLWVFDSGDYDEEERYSQVQKDQIDWYKETSEQLKAENGGEKVNSLVFQHIIVPEIYDALVKKDDAVAYSFRHIYNKGEYYHLNEENTNSGVLCEKPCPGYYNYGQFDALVEQGDVLAMFVGHDHSNSFSVKHKGIDIVNTLSARYNWPFGSTRFGYRVIMVDESDTTTYQTESVRYHDFIDKEFANSKKEVDPFGYKLALRLAFKGTIRKAFDEFCFKFVEFFTDRKVRF